MEKLAHLPLDKREQILEILEIIKDVALPEKVILFGSFARGDWVDDEYLEGGATYSYRSDFDFLVVTNGSKLQEFEIKNRIENRTGKFKHPVNPLVHEIDHINYGLERGQYFFSDIIKNGILLYDTNRSSFISPRPLSIQQQKENAQIYYENWLESAIRMVKITEGALKIAYDEDYNLNEVMFLIHQITERLYAGLGLIFTGYKPKTHSIKEYRNYTKSISREVYDIFCYPKNDQEEKRLFEILQRSYIDSRYKLNYKIDKVDLEIIFAKVKNLKDLVVKLSLDRINSFI